jgi:4-amino-4-deoxy-L-arabinose transferase-like glycosyltransferase
VDNPFARLTHKARQIPTRSISTATATALILSVAAMVWAPHLAHSLWLDETLTYWVVKDGLWDAVTRGVQFQSQPAYYIVIWLWTQIAGVSEIALRLPSLVAALAACVALARLGTRLTGDREFGLLAAVVFATTAVVFREAVDARPYALGVVLLICLALSLVSWLDKGRWRNAWGVGLLGAIIPHIHIFFALTYPAFILYGAIRWQTGRHQYRHRQTALIAALLTLGALLSIPAALTLLANQGSYSFAPVPRVRTLFSAFVWVPAVAGLLAGLCVDGIVRKGPRATDHPRADSKTSQFSPATEWGVGSLVTVWSLTPLLVLFSVSTLTDTSIFLDRYLITSVPAVSLLYATAIRRIDSSVARNAAMIVIALACFVLYVRPVDDFRGAALAVNQFVDGDDSVPVLFASGLIESQAESWLSNPELADYLKAPTAYYPLDGQVVLLPRVVRLLQDEYSEEARIGDEIVDPILRRAGRFAVVEWTGNGADVMPWLIERAERAGYQRIRNRRFGRVRVAHFRYAGADRKKN